MNKLSLFIGALAVSGIHALLPSHWLPFVLIGRAEKWNNKKIYSALFLAGGGHVLFTSFLGIAAVWIGKRLLDYVEGLHLPISSSILILFGIIYIVIGLLKHSHEHEHQHTSNIKSGTIFLSLIIMLTFSPCEAMVPLFLSAATQSWKIVIFLAFAMTIGTMASMFLLTFFALKGAQKLEFEWLEHHDKLVIGLLLLILGVLALFF